MGIAIGFSRIQQINLSEKIYLKVKNYGFNGFNSTFNNQFMMFLYGVTAEHPDIV